MLISKTWHRDKLAKELRTLRPFPQFNEYITNRNIKLLEAYIRSIVFISQSLFSQSIRINHEINLSIPIFLGFDEMCRQAGLP